MVGCLFSTLLLRCCNFASSLICMLSVSQIRVFHAANVGLAFAEAVCVLSLSQMISDQQQSPLFGHSGLERSNSHLQTARYAVLIQCYSTGDIVLAISGILAPQMTATLLQTGGTSCCSCSAAVLSLACCDLFHSQPHERQLPIQWVPEAVI